MKEISLSSKINNIVNQIGRILTRDIPINENPKQLLSENENRAGPQDKVIIGNQEREKEITYPNLKRYKESFYPNGSVKEREIEFFEGKNLGKQLIKKGIDTYKKIKMLDFDKDDE